jgi:hypothetical protein
MLLQKQAHFRSVSGCNTNRIAKELCKVRHYAMYVPMGMLKWTSYAVLNLNFPECVELELSVQ